jgi:hypothetical protein
MAETAQVANQAERADTACKPIWECSARDCALDDNKHFESRPHDVPDELPSDFVRDAG